MTLPPLPPSPNLTERDAVDCAAAYVETAFAALDRGDVLGARAALRRVAQHLLSVGRWDAVNGAEGGPETLS